MSIILETERLILREMTQLDYPALAAILQDEQTMYAYEGAFNNDETRSWLDKNLTRYQEDGIGLWAVVLKESGEMIGQAGLTWQDINGKQVPEVGYLFNHAYWGKGYATEAAIACKEYGFGELGFNEIYSIVRNTNIPSMNVAIRNSMLIREQYIKHYRGVDMPHYVFSVRTATVETDEERLRRIYPVILSEYNPSWKAWYEEEKTTLERLLGLENIVRISHYGSTSVPGLTAKPTIDILLEIHKDTDINKLITALSTPDYICLDESRLTMPTSPPHLMFLKGYLSDGFAEKVYHIHVVYSGDHDELLFRDYLIAHPEAALAYATLKRELFNHYEHNRDGYTDAKTDFVKSIVRKARGG